MPSDYAKITADHKDRYGWDNDDIRTHYAQLYPDRAHFIFELLQNAEDALRWRADNHPTETFSRHVKFHLFPKHLEVTHFGLQFAEEHVRGVCSKKGTKQGKLTDIGKFGIGFKSVYAYTRRPEVHSGDENFVIESFLFPRGTAPREKQPGQTLFYIPFDYDEVPWDQAHAEIGTRLAKLGSRTLLFLNQIESVDWEIAGSASGSYIRESKLRGEHKEVKEVTLIGQVNVGDKAKPLDEQHWLVFSKAVTTPKIDPAGWVEVAFSLAKEGEGSKWSVVRAEDSNLVVFFPTEVPTDCGFLMQGPYKTTPSRDNVPHDNQWNSHLVKETAMLVSEALRKLATQRMACVGLLNSMPLLQRYDIRSEWMFQPVYDAVVETLLDHPLIPAPRGRLVSGRCARIARGKGLIDLFGPKQLALLLGADDATTLDWVTPEISEREETSSLFGFLKYVLNVEVVEPDDLPPHLDEKFFREQSPSWMSKFYAFLLDHEELWRRNKSRVPLLNQPFIRLQDKRHITPFAADGTPNAFLPGDTETEFATVDPVVAKPKKCAEFLSRLGLTEPDVTTEVLQKIIPQYEPDETDIPDKKHHAHLRKIFRALASNSPHRPALVEQLKAVSFLTVVKLSSRKTCRSQPDGAYFRTKQLATFFEGHDEVWFLAEPVDLIEKNKALLQELGVEDKPRRDSTSSEHDQEMKRELRAGLVGLTSDNVQDHDIHGLDNFLNRLARLEKLNYAEAIRRARLLWDFLLLHLKSYPTGSEQSFFRGEYSWQYYKQHSKEFDARFVTVLRSTAWLPGNDGMLHKPSELLPQNIAPGFVPNPTLSKELQMKEDVFVNFAKETGHKVELVMFLDQHPEKVEKLMREVMERLASNVNPAADSKRTTGAQPELEEAKLKANWNSANPETTPAPIATKEPPVIATPDQVLVPPPAGDIADPLKSLLGPNFPEPTPISSELNSSVIPAGHSPSATTTGGSGRKSTGRSGTSTGGASQDGKYFTYLYVSPESETSDSAEAKSDQQKNTDLEQAGVKFVLEFERKAGRQPKEMAQGHEGYDVESYNGSNSVERFIEVKSISAAWGERGVTLTLPEFRAAQKHKENFWLYVVENAHTDHPQLYRIRNPAGRVKSFAYDQGWRVMAEPN